MKSELAGIMISIGALTYLAIDVKWVGALFFCFGLFVILEWGLNLFTGKVCYILVKEDWTSFVLFCLKVLLGNAIGAVLTGLVCGLLYPQLAEKAATIVAAKTSEDILEVFILAMFCNFCIAIAVDGYTNSRTDIGKYLSIIFGVSIFVICGFEHCVANMFYISIAGAWTWESLYFLLINILGNALGGMLMGYSLLEARRS